MLFSFAGMQPETVAFKARVLADGGEIIDLNYVNSEIRRLKQVGMWNKIFAYPSVEFAVKKDASNNVEKIYCLKRALMDLIQTNTSYKGIYEIAANGRPCVKLDGINDYYQSGTDYAMVQPLTNWFNFYSNAYTTFGYYYDGRLDFDNCRIAGQALIAFSGHEIYTPFLVEVNNTGRIRTVFNGASSSHKVNYDINTGDIGTNPMYGITLGKPGGSFATNSQYNQAMCFHSLLIMQGVSDSIENNSTDLVYSSRYI
jgi:hypothetical protein